MNEFDDIFSKSDILGMMMKATFKEALRESVKKLDKDMAVAYIEMMQECHNEILEEYKEK